MHVVQIVHVLNVFWCGIGKVEAVVGVWHHCSGGSVGRFRTCGRVGPSSRLSENTLRVACKASTELRQDGRPSFLRTYSVSDTNQCIVQ